MYRGIWAERTLNVPSKLYMGNLPLGRSPNPPFGRINSTNSFADDSDMTWSVRVTAGKKAEKGQTEQKWCAEVSFDEMSWLIKIIRTLYFFGQEVSWR